MAATYTKQSAGSGGKAASAPVFVDRVKFDADNSYPSGGYPMDLTLVEGQTILAVVPMGESALADARVVYDHTNDKVQVFVPSTGAEVADTTDLTNLTALLLVLSN